MTPDDTRLNELFGSARSLPPAVDLERVRHLIDAFPEDGGGPASDDGPLINPKTIFTMLILLAFCSFLGWQLTASSVPARELTSAFPLEVRQHPVLKAMHGDSLPATSPSTEATTALLDRSGVAYPTVRPAVTTAAPTLAPGRGRAPSLLPTAPAAAPNGVVLADTIYAVDERGNISNKIVSIDQMFFGTPQYGEPLTGEWQWNKAREKVILTYTERRPFVYRSYVGLLRPTAEEMLALEATGDLERPAGRLRLMGKRKGRYTFEPNLTYRAYLLEAGIFPTDVVRDALNYHLKSVNANAFGGGDNRTVEEELYFRFFVADVGPDYLNALREMGYPEAALRGVWQLANAGITRQDLPALSELLRRRVTAVPRESLTELLLLHRSGRTLRLLQKEYGTAPNFTELTMLNEAGIGPELFGRYARSATPAPSLTDIAALHAGEVSPLTYGAYRDFFGADLTVGEAILLNNAELRGFHLEQLAAKGFTGRTPAEYVELHQTDERELFARQNATGGFVVDPDFAGRLAAADQREERTLRPFTKLKIDENMRVIIVPADENRMTASQMDFGKAFRFTVNERRDGTLVIKKKEKFGYSVYGTALVEILLYASDLERIEADGNTEVYIIGDPARYRANVPLGKAVLTE